MLNVLIPLAGKQIFFSEDIQFPKPLVEVLDTPMIQYVVNKLEKSLEGESCHFIFMVNRDDCLKYHIDNMLKLSFENSTVIQVEPNTAGAACTALLAIEHIDNEHELVICNSDSFVKSGIRKSLKAFRSKDAEAGVISFNSIHPKWSFAKCTPENEVVETAEKNPISKNAIAGFYYFKTGRNFVEAAMEMVTKRSHVDGQYFIAPALNELILKRKKVVSELIDASDFITFYSKERVREFELKEKLAKRNKSDC